MREEEEEGAEERRGERHARSTALPRTASALTSLPMATEGGVAEDGDAGAGGKPSTAFFEH